MTRVLHISVFALLVLVLLDLWSYRSHSPLDSVKKLDTHVQAEFDYFKNKLLDRQVLRLFEKDSLKSIELREIKSLNTELDYNRIQAILLRDNQKIFWTSNQDAADYCRNYARNNYRLKLCMDLFDENGILNTTIYNQSGISNQITRIKTDSLDGKGLQWEGIPLKSKGKYRSSRLNNVLLIIYLVLICGIVWQLFIRPHIAGFIVLAAARLSLLLVPQWHARFWNSDLMTTLFDWQTYSNIDLLLDMFILFNLLRFISSRTYSIQSKKYIHHYLLSYGFFLLLLIASHLRLTRFVALCDTFQVTINDISTVNIPEITVFIALILGLTGIFFYAVSYIQRLKKEYISSRFYICLVGLIALSTTLIYFLHPGLPLFYTFLFSSCFFILIDLFIDIEKKSITWVIWWAIFFSTYLAALFFNYDIQRQISQRQLFLEELFTDTLPDHTSYKTQLNSVLDSLGYLVANPEVERYDISDLDYYFENRLDNKRIKIDIIDNQGQSVFDNWNEKEFFQQPDSQSYFNPIDNYVWLKRNYTDSLQLIAGLQLKKPRELFFPFIIIKDHKVFNFALSPEREEILFMKSMDNEIQSQDAKVYIRYSHQDVNAYCTKEFESLVKPIALFSLLFTCIIFIFIIIGIASKYSHVIPEAWPVQMDQFDSLNGRIQTALILVILLSFVLIAAITSSFLDSFIDSKNNRFIEDKIESLTRDLNDRLQVANSAREAITIANNYKEDLQSKHNTSLNFYNFNQLDLESDYFAYAYFKKQELAKAFTKISGNNSYVSYIPMSFRGQRIAYIELKESSDAVKAFNVYDFLGSIFNIYVFLFLIASVLAIFIAKSITKPLSLLNQKLTALKLGKKNERISWEREDEVGKLIQNYNNMVSQLEDSAELLAKTERDNAWREMAKQVAHEIKNPLTPMRMYIQHLEKAIKQSPERAVEISKKISQTLLEQVENLTQIADSFSNFAELPRSTNEKIEINKVVELVHNLFRKRDDMEIVLSEPIDPIHVYADKNQLIRILNNLVKNAIESIPKDRIGRISLSLESKDDKAIICVEDNGSGIPIEMHDKIFRPKFTTKDSGSGLGLAIAQNMIESMNGRLYFNSTPGEGTRFYIELDIIRQKIENPEKRITLE